MSERAPELAPGLTPEVLRALPIFPLQGAVLMPRSLLPLHVFEPRYLAMTKDVLAGAGYLAIARLEPGFEADYQGRPPVARTIGVGRVVAAEDAPQGRRNILLAGVARAVIERELAPERLYREVEARLVPDLPADPAALRHKLGQLIAVCDRLADVLPAGGAELRQIVRVDGDPAAACDRVAGLLVTDADQRMSLLEEPAPLARATAVLDHASSLLISLSKPPAGPLN